MKIVAVNGSPRGKAGNTNKMIEALLSGACEKGAESINIILADKDINYCRGCYTCWTKTPGKCAIDDDMGEVLKRMKGADVIVLGTPVFFNNISGTLKVFMDRLALLGNPIAKKNEIHYDNNTERKTPVLLMMSNCGYNDRTQFDVISLWIKKVAILMGTNLIGEIYMTQGRFLTLPTEDTKMGVVNYLHMISEAGKEIVMYNEIRESTKEILNKNFEMN